MAEVYQKEVEIFKGGLTWKLGGAVAAVLDPTLIPLFYHTGL